MYSMQRASSSGQYYAYVEISEARAKPLWETYSTLAEQWDEVFAMQHIGGPADIYPVFQELFRKKSA